MEQVHTQVPNFINYRINRGAQNILCQKQNEKPVLQVGDQVMLPIPSVDRTGTDPKNVLAEVYKTEGEKFT